jgi:hypothetical protein
MMVPGGRCQQMNRYSLALHAGIPFHVVPTGSVENASARDAFQTGPLNAASERILSIQALYSMRQPIPAR